MHAIESKAQPSPPEPTMRPERTIQATIFEIFAGHEIGCELKAISQWLDRQRTLVSLVAGDLRRHGLRETGRRGLPAETVLRCALLKQQRQLSYEELAFHLEDSASFRAFARLPLAWSPKKSVLHQTVSAIRPETWEAVNRAVLVSAQQDKLESGATVRIDSTGAERQCAVVGCRARHDAPLAASCGVAGSTGTAVARSPAPGQEACASDRV
jgi:IS5 family transposase